MLLTRASYLLLTKASSLLLATALMSGCDAAGAPATSVVSPSANFAIFSGNIDLTGEITVKGRFTDRLTSRGETCDEYVRRLAPATTIWVVPAPDNGSAVGGHIVTLTAGIPNNKPSSGYLGPATYSQASAQVADLLIDNASFLAGKEALATIIVTSNGFGSLSFSGMVDTSTLAVESGKETWRCSD